MRFAFALVVAVSGCATAAPAPGSASPPIAVSGPERARLDSARYPYTEADVHFMTAMIGHHAQAIDMSRLAPTHGASQSVRTLAERIINSQEDEIATMQQWLADRHRPVPEAKAGPMRMTMDGMEHEMLMPGMLTDAQMQQLSASRGPAFDRLYLAGMIQHHHGAVTMVKSLFDTYGAAQDPTTFKFASDVNVDQTTEIARMERMLAALPH